MEPGERAELLALLAEDADPVVVRKAMETTERFLEELANPAEEEEKKSGEEPGGEAGEKGKAAEEPRERGLAQMNVLERIRLAGRGNREERMALMRDANKIVQRAVLQSPRVTAQEVESFAAMTNLSAEILQAIAKHRMVRKSTTVVRNLLGNPKTPLDVSLPLLPRLNATDLKLLRVNKNVPDTLRTAAARLYRRRTEGRDS